MQTTQGDTQMTNGQTEVHIAHGELPPRKTGAARVCDFLAWEQHDPFGGDRVMIGTDSLGRKIVGAELVTHLDGNRVWQVFQEDELDAAEHAGELFDAYDGVRKLCGTTFDARHDLELMADAAVGAAMGDVACRAWISSANYDIFNCF